MGISGLLPLLKSIQKPCHLKKFSGQTVGIDAYGWLHRGAHGCIMQLAMDKPTSKYVEFCMKRVHMLIHYGITPYLVFDGDYLPSKAETERERSTKRKEAKRTGEELMRLGKTAQAQQELAKAVNITPEMAKALMEELKKANVKYVVAPYEADAQMVYLERKGLISAILSEDSDLLVFGAKVLLTKLDQYGECVMVRRQDFTACREVSLVGWTDTDFRKMAILSGCDYLKNASSMGLKTAYRFVRKYKGNIERIVNAAKFDGKIKFPAGYLESFDQAEKTFLYPWVYCPEEQQLVHLTSLPEAIDVAALPFVGAFVEATVAKGVAQGDLHPHTKDPLSAHVLSKRSGNMDARLASIKKSSTTPSTASSSDSLKNGRPIESFFGRRIPLAELDPNNLRMSASQQRLLEENPSSFFSSSAPLQTSSRTRSAPQGGSQVQRAEPGRRSLPWSSHSRSTTNPAKRQRLCSEGMIETESQATDDAPTTSSRFFSSNKAETKMTASVAAKGRRRSTTHDFNLWSDDSVEDAMATMPEPVAVAEPADPVLLRRKKISILTDGPATPAREDDADTSQMTVMTNVTFDSQISEAGLTPATSVGSPPRTLDEVDASPFSQHLNKDLAELRSKYTLHTSTPSLQHPVKPKALSRTVSAPAGRTVPFKGLPFSPLSTLRTKGSRASPQSNASIRVESGLTGVSQSDFNDEDWQKMESEIASTSVEPPSEIVPVTPPKERPASPLKRRFVGSEDLLVPDSEGEEVDGERRSSGASLPFDVSRFAFVPSI